MVQFPDCSGRLAVGANACILSKCLIDTSGRVRLYILQLVGTLISSSQLRRLVVFVEHFPPFLGSDRTVFELARRVAEHNVRVHFVATQPLRYLLGNRPPDWEYKDNWTHPPPRIHTNITARYLVLGSRMLSLWRLTVPMAYLITLLLFTRRAINEINRHGADIVVVANASPLVGIVALLSARLAGCRLIMGCPDWMTAYAASLTEGRMDSLRLILLNLLEMRLYKGADAVFTVTAFLKRVLTRYGVDPDKIRVIPNGVDTQQFSPLVDGSDVRRDYGLGARCVILLSGHLEDWAGVSLVHDLAGYLDKEFPKSCILLVGTGSSVVSLMESISRDNLTHMVTYAGLQPFDRMPEFNGACDIALCVFPRTFTSHAASPLKIFESMSAGKAIVATRVAGTAEVLDNNTAVLVPPSDTVGICDAVVKLCRDPALRARLGGNARAIAEGAYSWNRLAERFLEECSWVMIGR